MSKKKHCIYSETFRLEVLRDYYSSGNSLNAITRKWGLSSRSLLIGWRTRYPAGSLSLSLEAETIASYMEKSGKEKSKEALLSDEIVRLRQALELEKLRSRAFEKLIEITEKEEGISILKKGGAKQ